MKNIVILFLTSGLWVSCSKKLDIKPNQSMVVPSSVNDYQKLLDNISATNVSYPIIGESGSDDYYLESTVFSSLTTLNQRLYTWEKDVFPVGVTISDWNISFNKILITNVVLDGITKLTEQNSNEYKNVKGSALFIRAFTNFNLVQLFCKPYNPATANTDLGLPLRINPNFNEKVIRSNLEQTYQHIIDDLNAASQLLPETTVYKTRPSKNAALALLARIYLIRHDYNNAFIYANNSLSINPILLDYSSILTSNTFPFQPFNSEVIFHAELSNIGSAFATQNGFNVDTSIARSYVDNDLRKQLYLTSSGKNFRGSYVGANTFFGGIANDEMYLIRAEANARLGKTDASIKDLNNLLRSRWKKIANVTTYVDQTAANAADALTKILIERRKELLYRGLRWSDLRRLNITGGGIALVRSINGVIYNLPANDSKYTYPIPEYEVAISGLEQNQR